MKTSSQNVLINIIKIRNDRGLTQAALAQALNVDYSTYSKLESGGTKLTVERLEEIASFFKMDMVDILTYPQKYVSESELPETALQKRKPKILVQIEIDEDKKEQVLNVLFGENNMNIFNK